MITTIQYGKVKVVNSASMYDKCIDALIIGGMWYAIFILDGSEKMVAVPEGIVR